MSGMATCRVPGAGWSTAARARPWRPDRGTASTRTSCCSTPGRARSSATSTGPPHLRRRPRTPAAHGRCATTRHALKARVVDDRFDWNGDAGRAHAAGRHSVIYEVHVQGLHACACPACPRPLRGTYLGLASRAGDRPPEALGVTPSACCRCSSIDEQHLVQTRPAQLLGLQHHRLLLPFEPRYATAPGRRQRATSSAAWCRRCTPPASRCCWTWSTTTRRSRRARARRCQLARPGQRQLVPPAARSKSRLREPQRLRQHAGPAPPARAAAGAGQPALLGAEMHVDGFRFDLAPVLGRGDQGFDRRRLLHGPAAGPGAGRRAPDRRALGHRPRAATSWASSRPAGWNGTTASATPMRAFWLGGDCTRGELRARLCGSSPTSSRRAAARRWSRSTT
jgi:hypothetical protein